MTPRGGLSIWLQFFRVRLLPTAWANGATGAIAAGAVASPPTLSDAALAAVTIGALYLFGMGANDWCDRRRDATQAPHRPIPSGGLSSTRALGSILIALAIALTSAAFLPSRTWVWVGSIVGSIVLYDAFLKDQSWLGPLAMGSVRAFVAIFGASLVGEPIDGLLPAVILGGHSFWVTRYSLKEESSDAEALDARARAVIAHSGSALILAILFIPTPWLWHLGWLTPMGAWIQFDRARRRYPPGWFTFRSLRVLLLLDGSLHLSYNSPVSAAVCALLFLGTGAFLPPRPTSAAPSQTPLSSESALE